MPKTLAAYEEVIRNYIATPRAMGMQCDPITALSFALTTYGTNRFRSRHHVEGKVEIQAAGTRCASRDEASRAQYLAGILAVYTRAHWVKPEGDFGRALRAWATVFSTHVTADTRWAEKRRLTMTVVGPS